MTWHVAHVRRTHFVASTHTPTFIQQQASAAASSHDIAAVLIRAVAECIGELLGRLVVRLIPTRFLCHLLYRNLVPLLEHCRFRPLVGIFTGMVRLGLGSSGIIATPKKEPKA
jgi:hypothetical protein